MSLTPRQIAALAELGRQELYDNGDRYVLAKTDLEVIAAWADMIADDLEAFKRVATTEAPVAGLTQALGANAAWEETAG